MSDLLGIELKDWLTIFAVISGPLIGIQVQKRIESLRDRRGRQLYIFRALMATRATPLHPDHVTALNLIDIDFSERRRKEKSVVRSWRVLLDQYGKYPRQNDFQDNNEYLIALNAANSKVQDYLVDLLLKMSESLGYDFETIHIRNGCYAPTGHAELENDNKLIRKGALMLLGGQIPLNMNVKSFPEQSPDENVLAFLKGASDNQDQTLKVLQNISEKLESGSSSKDNSIEEDNNKNKK